jgi:hypothetical protein
MTEKTSNQGVLKLNVGQVEITPVMERIYEYENRENEIKTLETQKKQVCVCSLVLLKNI